MEKRVSRFVAPLVMLLGMGVTMLAPSIASAQHHDHGCRERCEYRYHRCMRYAHGHHERRHCEYRYHECRRECRWDNHDDHNHHGGRHSAGAEVAPEVSVDR